MFFVSSNGQNKKLNQKDCKIVLEIETREGFDPMFRVRFTDPDMDMIVFADELHGERDFVTKKERDTHIKERDARKKKNPVVPAKPSKFAKTTPKPNVHAIDLDAMPNGDSLEAITDGA